MPQGDAELIDDGETGSRLQAGTALPLGSLADRLRQTLALCGVEADCALPRPGDSNSRGCDHGRDRNGEKHGGIAAICGRFRGFKCGRAVSAVGRAYRPAFEEIPGDNWKTL